MKRFHRQSPVVNINKNRGGVKKSNFSEKIRRFHQFKPNCALTFHTVLDIFYALKLVYHSAIAQW
jgi:hypothetical protein